MKNWSWIFKMAVKDASSSKNRLVIYIGSIVLGIAALVAIQSFSESVTAKINADARELVGADMVVRSNLADGDVTYDTYAESAMSGSNETSFASYSVDSEVFVEGDNVLAVEVHQATASSSDLGFDLTLEVQLLTDPE